jgi:hypothetical protein
MVQESSQAYLEGAVWPAGHSHAGCCRMMLDKAECRVPALASTHGQPQRMQDVGAWLGAGQACCFVCVDGVACLVVVCCAGELEGGYACCDRCAVLAHVTHLLTLACSACICSNIGARGAMHVQHHTGLHCMCCTHSQTGSCWALLSVLLQHKCWARWRSLLGSYMHYPSYVQRYLVPPLQLQAV